MAGVGRHDAWTDEELQLLYDVVNLIDWFDDIAAKIDRTESAIRTKMSALRREAEIMPKMRGPRAKADAAAARDDLAAQNERYLAAIEAAAA